MLHRVGHGSLFTLEEYQYNDKAWTKGDNTENSNKKMQKVSIIFHLNPIKI